MSRTRLVAGAALVVAAAAAPAGATYVGVSPGAPCVPSSVFTVGCPVPVGAGADLLAPGFSPGGHTMAPVCRWNTVSPTELQIVATVHAPGSSMAAVTCHFRLGTTDRYLSTLPGNFSAGSAFLTEIVPMARTVSACVVNASAEWADGDRQDQAGCTPA